MKKTDFAAPLGRWGAGLLLAVALTGGMAHAQATSPNLPASWQWQDPLPQGFSLNDVQAVNDSVAWVAGNQGTLLKTTDRGRRWQVLPIGINRDLLGVSFGSAQVGWVIYNTPSPDAADPGYATGPAEIRRTTDGGATWTATRLPSYRKFVQMHAVQALSATEAYVLYSDPATLGGYLCHTADGGQTWQQRQPVGMVDAARMQFVTSQRGYRATRSPSAVLKTVNGGQSWQVILYSPDVDYSAMAFADSLHGWAAGRNRVGGPNCFVTQNGGRTWQPQAVNPQGSTYYVNALAAATPSQALAISDDVRKTITANGGTTWQLAEYGTYINAVRLRPSGAGWAVGVAGAIDYTADFGTTWSRRTPSVSADKPFIDLQFPDPEHGWALPAYDKAVVRTRRRGTPWQRVPLTGVPGIYWPLAGVRSLAFPDRDTGYVYVPSQNPSTGNILYNHVLKTTDGGSTWAVQTLPLTGRYLPTASLRFANPRRGALVGNGGLVCRTADGGQSWQAVPSGTRRTLAHLAWADARTAYAVGDTLTVVRTTDGGQSWQLRPAPPSFMPGAALQALSFPTAQVGYVASLLELFRTANGGTTWQPLTLPADVNSVTSLSFLSPQQGWISNGQVVYATTNGGQTWTRKGRFGLNGVTLDGPAAEVALVDRYNGWGTDRAIIRYSEKFIQADTTLARRAYCAGESLSLPFALTGSFAGESNFLVQLSNSMGRFRPGQTRTVGSGTASPLAVTLPAALPPGSRYRLRVIQRDSLVLGADNGRDLLITAPVPPATLTRLPGGPLQATLPAGTAAPARYEWERNGLPVPGQSGPQLPAPAAGSYRVRACSAICCGPWSAATALATAAQVLDAQVQVWPNPVPAGGPGWAVTAPARTTLTLRNALGQVLRPAVSVGTSGTLRLPTAGLAPGLYVLRVRAEGGEISRRLVVE